MKVEFTEDVVTLDGSGKVRKNKSFKRGQVVELSSASAWHWLNRNKARLFQGKAAKPPEPETRLVPKSAPEPVKAEEKSAEPKAEAPEPAAPDPIPLKRGPGRPPKTASS